MRTTSARRNDRRGNPHSNPVAIAMATNRMRNQLRTVGIELFMTADGEQARGLVSHLVWIIGIGAEIAANTAPGSEQARRQHTMLRNLVQIATESCTWRAALAEQIWTAAQEAYGLMVEHPTLGLAVMPGADDLAGRVTAGKARMSDVAGAEIYQEASH